MQIFSLLLKHAARVAISLVVLVILLLNTSEVLNFGFIKRLENFTYDVRLNLMMPSTVDDRIVIVDIDEKSLQEQGRWPWGRNKLATLLDQLFDRYHIKVIGFDVVFAEKDESSGLKNLEDIRANYMQGDAEFDQVLAELRPKLDYDRLFAKSLQGRNVVMGYYFTQDSRGNTVGILPHPSFVEGSFAGKNIFFKQATGYGANLQILQENARSGGHFNPDPDDDGITRKVPVLYEYKGAVYEALPVAIAKLALGAQRLEAGFAKGMGVGKKYAGLEWLNLGARKIPVDGKISSLIPYRGKQGSFPYVSATDVINGKADPDVLKDRIVLLGTTAPGLMDLRATPVQNIYAGVEVHANMIAGILDQNIKERPAYTMGAEFVLLLLIGLLLALALPLLNPLMATALTLGAFVFVLMFNLFVWQYANLVLPLASMLVMISSMYVLNMSYGFFIESRGKKQLAGLFGQYVPPELVDEMVDKGVEDFSLEGESRELTVLFSDVRGFTTISEGLDPKQLSQLMNEFLTPMTHVIHHNRGTIDKYMGDAIMAFWGAPLADNLHARHALDAAMGMLKSLEILQQEFKAKGWPEIKIGVGLNTGMMTVGNMGSEFRMAYTVMGDAVNLGSRLESLTKNYGVYIIVSEFTKEKVPEYLYRELDIVRVKGKDKPVAIFEPVCLSGEEDKATKDELKLYRETLKLYRGQNWDLAEMQFINLQKQYPDRKLYEIYSKRIAFFRQNPPGQDWDGVFTFDTK